METCYQHLVSGGQNKVHDSTPPHTHTPRYYPAPNVNSAAVEKPVDKASLLAQGM